MHILIAEDNNDVAHLLSGILKSAGYSTHIVHDGVEAIKYLKSESSNINLVITDIVMPKNDGLDVINYIRQNTKIKIIAITGGGTTVSAQNTMDAIKSQVDACLLKPFMADDIEDCVKKILES